MVYSAKRNPRRYLSQSVPPIPVRADLPLQLRWLATIGTQESACPFGRICRSSSAGLLPRGRKNPPAANISICRSASRRGDAWLVQECDTPLSPAPPYRCGLEIFLCTCCNSPCTEWQRATRPRGKSTRPGVQKLVQVWK